MTREHVFWHHAGLIHDRKFFLAEAGKFAKLEYAIG